MDLITLLRIPSAIKSIIDILNYLGIEIKDPFIQSKLEHYIKYNQISKFTDRKTVLSKINLALMNGDTVNVIGSKGSGKSHTLKFFCDCINKNVDKKIRKEYGLYKNTINKYCLYFDLTHQRGLNGIIDSLFIETDSDNIQKIGKLFAEQNTKLLRSQEAIIVLDNVNNQGIYKDISNLIDRYLQIRHKDLFIIGSIDKFKASSESYLTYINVDKFTCEDIQEYYKKHDITNINEKHLNKIYEFTKNGLPLLVQIIRNFPLEQLLKVKEREIYKFINDELIETLDTETHNLLVLLSFLNISSTTIRESDIKKVFQYKNYESLKKSLIDLGLLIETGKNIKIHDELRDLISANNISNYKHYESKINKYIQNSNSDKKIFYKLLSFYENPNNPKKIIDMLNNEIKKNNFSIFEELLLLMKKYDLEFSQYPNLQFTLYYGIAYSYNGMGRYILAQNFLNHREIQNTLTVLDKNNYLNYKILNIDILHMLNDYHKSEELLEQLIKKEINSTNYELMAQCYWKLGHIKLHQGKNFNLVFKDYQSSISYRKVINNNIYIFNSIIETAIVELLKNNLTYINELLKYEDDFKLEKLSYVSYTRVVSRFYKITGNFKSAHKYIDESYYEAKENLSKLYNNAELEKADIYRAEEKFEKSIESYQKVLNYTAESSDLNLELSSSLGIVISKFLADIDYYQDENELLEELNFIILKCEELKINITYLRAQVVKFFINKKLDKINDISKIALLNILRSKELYHEVSILETSNYFQLKTMQSTIF